MSKFNFRKRRLAAIITALLVMCMLSSTIPLNAAEVSGASTNEANQDEEQSVSLGSTEQITGNTGPDEEDSTEDTLQIDEEERLSDIIIDIDEDIILEEKFSRLSESNISLDEDFLPDEVLVVLKHSYSNVNVFSGKDSGRYEIAISESLFYERSDDIGIDRIEDLSAMYINDSADHVTNPAIDTRDPVSVRRYEDAVNFHQILRIILKNSGKENVLEATDIPSQIYT